MKKYLLTALSVCFALSAISAEVEFSYNPDNLASRGFGYDKEETYDVAVYINDVSLNGAVVKGIEVPVPGGTDISGTSVWLTSELKLKKKNGRNVNNPDIVGMEGTLSDGMLRVMFDTPHVIDGPFYAGYSFTVDALTDVTSAPVMVTDVMAPGGLFIHSSKTKLKWMDCQEDAFGSSVLRVILDGDFKENSAAVAWTDRLFVSAEDEAVVTVDVVNHGTNSVSSVEYTYSYDGGQGSGSKTFDTPVAVFSESAEVEVSLGRMSELGVNDVTFTVTKVNGADNGDTAASMVVPVKVYPFIPVNRPLVEEYTGLWCGWCVRGYVALETMKERYPEQFVGLAYHDGDPMAIDLERPSQVSGYPSAFVNRSKAKINIADIYTIWPEFIKDIAPASIDVKVSWTDDTKSAIKAESESRFIDSYDNGDFAICYALIEDGMSDPKWAQYNAYAPAEGEEPKDYPEMPGELGRIFTHGPKSVYGLTFNDVVLALPQPFGYTGSVPAEIEAGETYRHSCIINVDDIVNVYGDPVVQDRTKLRVVAAMIDRKTNRAVNCSSSGYADMSSVGTVGNGADIVSTTYYDMQGREIRRPGNGIYIRIDRLSDGTTRSHKTII